MIDRVLLFGSASPSTPPHVTLHATAMFLKMSDANRPNKPKPALLSLSCIYFHRFFSQSHSGGVVLLGKTSFVQKGRSMFPKVLLQWCTAISSCAAQIGKLLLGSTTFVRLLCQQATCAVRIWHSAATATLSQAIRAGVVVWPVLMQSCVTTKWAAGLSGSAETQHRVMPLSWCGCILVKGISLLL